MSEIIFIIFLLGISLFFAIRIAVFNRKEKTFAGQIAKLEKEFAHQAHQQKRLLVAWDSLEQGVILLDSNNVVEYLNPQAEKLLGIVGKTLVNQKITQKSKGEIVMALSGMLAQEHPYSFKKEITHGDHCTLLVAIHRLVTGHNYLGRMVIIQDVTKGKIIERTKMDFVALTAHQLNVPLSTTRLSLGMLLDGSLGKITKNQREVIKKTLQRNNMLIGLVSDLMDISKIQERHHAYHWDLVDAGALVKSVVDADLVELHNKKIHFTLQNPKAPLMRLVLDKDKMFVAIKNLLDNAIKYTPERGKIVMSYHVENKEFHFSISDSGIGVPSVEQEKLFSRFFRAQNAVAFESSGSGLGLFIVKNIIEAHHGKIWFESTEHEGSTFHFSLPVREVE